MNGNKLKTRKSYYSMSNLLLCGARNKDIPDKDQDLGMQRTCELWNKDNLVKSILKEPEIPSVISNR